MKHSCWFLINAVLALALAPPCFARAATDEKSPDAGTMVVIYSNACVHPESGDLLGERLFVFREEGSVFFLYQEAGGVWDDPFSGKAEIESGKIRFSFALHGKPETFRGTITSQEVVGRFDSGAPDPMERKIYRLPRKKNENIGVDVCR
jgi:hypothetical protein